MTRGAAFGEIAPKNTAGQIRTQFTTVPASAHDIDNGVIFPVTPTGNTPDRYNSFRMGQQILFWFGIGNPIVGVGPAQNWITRARFKLWWLRPNLEYRAPGAFPGPRDLPPGSGWTPLDKETFGDGPAAGVANNRNGWVPSVKRLDTSPFGTPPPPNPGPGNSDSIMLDDILTWDLQDPTVTAYAANFPAPQIPSRWSVFMYPAMGYALGVTAAVDYKFPPSIVVAKPGTLLSVSYTVGTLGGTNYQESMG